MKIKKEFVLATLGIVTLGLVGRYFWMKRAKEFTLITADKVEEAVKKMPSANLSGMVFGNDVDGWFLGQGGGKYLLEFDKTGQGYIASKKLPPSLVKPMNKEELDVIPLLGVVDYGSKLIKPTSTTVAKANVNSPFNGFIIGNSADGWFAVSKGERYAIKDETAKTAFITATKGLTKSVDKTILNSLPLVGKVDAVNKLVKA